MFFLSAAAIEAANSGSDVPQAIRVSDINASLTPNDFAIITALSTKKSQLVINIASPAKSVNIDFHKGAMMKLVGIISKLE